MTAGTYAAIPVVLVALLSSAIQAQELPLLRAETFIKAGMPAPFLDHPIAGGDPEVQLTVGKDEKRAVLSLGDSFSNGTQWLVKFSSPWNDADDEGQLATLDGLAGGIKAELSFTRSFFTPRPTPDVAKLNAVCGSAKASLGQRAAALECDDRLYDQVTSHRVLSQVMDAYFSEGALIKLLSGRIEIGEDEFEYLDAALANQSTEKVGWGAAIDGVLMHPVKSWSLILSYQYQEAYKNDAAGKATVCTPIDGATAQSCKEAFLKPPSREATHIAAIDLRKQFTGAPAFSLRVSYDLEDDVLGVSLPIYLLSTKEGGLAGGIKFGWRDDEDDLTAGIFVSSNFSLLP